MIFSLNCLLCSVLLKGLKIAFVGVFEICNQISFALILKLAPDARKATSVQSSKCSRAANYLARGRARLADFGFIQETLTRFSSKWLLLDEKKKKKKKCTQQSCVHQGGKKPISPGSSNNFLAHVLKMDHPKSVGNKLMNIFSSSR